LNRNFIITYSSLSVGLQELNEIQCSHASCHHLLGMLKVIYTGWQQKTTQWGSVQ